MAKVYKVRTACIGDHVIIGSLLESRHLVHVGNIKERQYQQQERFREYQTHRLLVYETDENDMEVVVGYAEFRNYPSMNALPDDCWEDWLRHHYCVNITLGPMNTLFVSFLVYLNSCKKFIEELFNELFLLEHKVHFVVAVRPPSTDEYEEMLEDYSELECYATVFYPREYSAENNKNMQRLYVIPRTAIVTEMFYRKALPGDNDDIVEIQDNEKPFLREQLGDYYIAEELLREERNGTHQEMIIVAENTNENAELVNAGFLWLSEVVDIETLIVNFELESFGNLIHPPLDGEAHKFTHLEVQATRRKHGRELFSDAAMKDMQEQTITGGMMYGGSDSSVASFGKMLLTSRDGNIDENYDDFYEREQLYMKLFMYDRLRLSINYFTTMTAILNLYTQIPDGMDINKATIGDASNVFQLKCFGVQKWHGRDVLHNFLQCMFSAYKNRDYCIYILDRNEPMTETIYEVLKYFLCVPQRPGCKIGDEIYITHRATLYGELSIHEFRDEDCEHVFSTRQSAHLSDSLACATSITTMSLLENETKRLNEIITEIQNEPESTYRLLTIRCGNSAKSIDENTYVGFVVLRPFMHYHLLKKQYTLPDDDFSLTHQRAEVVMLKLHPLLAPWCDELFRELARKTNYRDFYYIKAIETLPLPNDLIINMMPVEPRRKKRNWFIKTDKAYFEKKTNTLTYDSDHLVIARHNLNPSKFLGNQESIVIIGFSTFSKAFLRSMVFSWNSKDSKSAKTYCCLPHLNITVIVKPGVVEAEYEREVFCPVCTNKADCYLHFSNWDAFVRDTTRRIDLRCWVRFVNASIMEINRARKFIKLENSCEIQYDKLLLMCHTEHALNDLFDQNKHLPHNYAQINSRLDKVIMYHKMQALKMDSQLKSRVLVYGACIRVFECIAFLVKHGLDPSRITLAIPYYPQENEADQLLNNPNHDANIELILLEMITDLNVHILERHNYVRMVRRYGRGDFLSAVEFKCFPHQKTTTISCDYFINFDENYIEPHVQRLLLDADIKLNGKAIVVNENFQTNDENIYALGKYIQIVPQPNYQYIHISPREASEKLMHILGLKNSWDLQEVFEYRYSRPVYFQALLPMSYFFMKTIIPKRYLANHLPNEFSDVMTTYDGDFCRIRMNDYKIIEEITVVARERMALDHWVHFVGKHEAMLNNIRSRWKMGYVDSFLAFFSEPWTELLMHEDFSDLQVENKRRMLPIVGGLINMELERTVRNKMLIQMLTRTNKKALELGLLRFLRNHRSEFLNEFALPEDFPTFM